MIASEKDRHIVGKYYRSREGNDRLVQFTEDHTRVGMFMIGLVAIICDR